MTDEEKKKWENSIKSLGDESSRGGRSFLEKLEEGGYKKPWAIGFLLIAFSILVFSFWAFDTILVIFAIYCIPQILGYFLFVTSDSESGTGGGIYPAGGRESLVALILALASIPIILLTTAVGFGFLALISKKRRREVKETDGRESDEIYERKMDRVVLKEEEQQKKELVFKSDLERLAEELEDQLEELKEQLDKGIITEEEYEGKMVEVREEYERKKKKESEKWEKSVKW